MRERGSAEFSFAYLGLFVVEGNHSRSYSLEGRFDCSPLPAKSSSRRWSKTRRGDGLQNPSSSQLYYITYQLHRFVTALLTLGILLAHALRYEILNLVCAFACRREAVLLLNRCQLELIFVHMLRRTATLVSFSFKRWNFHFTGKCIPCQILSEKSVLHAADDWLYYSSPPQGRCRC